MDERLMLEAMEKASDKHKSIFFMTDKGSSFVVVGVKEKKGPGAFYAYCRSIDGIEPAAQSVKDMADKGDRKCGSYFVDAPTYEQWIVENVKRSMI